MSKLCVLKLPVGWERVSSTENEMVLVFPGRDSSIYAKVRLVDFIGNAKEIEEEMKRKALKHTTYSNKLPPTKKRRGYPLLCIILSLFYILKIHLLPLH